MFPSAIELSALDGATGFALKGGGRSVASAGDVNGDGIDDLVIESLRPGPNREESGLFHVVFGSSSGFASEIDLFALDGAAGFTLNGPALNGVIGAETVGDQGGFWHGSVSSAGDVNGDGIDDLLIGWPRADPNGRLSGQSFVVFGSSDGFEAEIELSELDGATGFALNGPAIHGRYNLYTIPPGIGSAASAGDVNGDGFDDVIIGSVYADADARAGMPYNDYIGQSFVVFGAAGGFAPEVELSALDGATGFALNGFAGGETSGRSVASAGDVNGDGFDDLIIGADGAAADAGRAYVVFGSSEPFAKDFDLSTLDGGPGFMIKGVRAHDRAGFSVASAGDVDGDGLDDMIVGAYGAGRSYVVFGSSTGFPSRVELDELDADTGVTLTGPAVSGFSVASAGDVNGDGLDDVIVGSPYAGKGHVVFGSSSGLAARIDLSELDGVAGFALNGRSGFYRTGASVASAGDLNGDGIDDVIIGSGLYPSESRSYVVFGMDAGNARPFAVDDDFTVDAGAPLVGADVLTNDNVVGPPLAVLSFAAEGMTAAAGGTIALANGATLSVAADGAVAFAQNGAYLALAAGDVETLRFDYEVPDGLVGTGAAAIAVNGVNEAPTLAPATLSATEDGGAVALDLSAFADDVDSNDDPSTLSYAVTGAPAEGAASFSGSVLTFDPGAAFDDLDDGQRRDLVIGVTVADSHGATAASDVALTVAGINDAPVAADDGATVGEDLATTGDVLANDVDPDLADALVVISVGGVAADVGMPVRGLYGTLTLNADGTYVYAADRADALIGGEVREDAFVYVVSDGDAEDAGLLTVDVVGANESFFGSSGKDVFRGGGGDDRAAGGDGNDVLNGRGGNDRLNGGDGSDRMGGQKGADRLNGQDGRDRINGGDGNDVLNGGRGCDRLNGGDGSDRMGGHKGADRLNGQDSRDRMRGGDGNDVLNGGGGGDRLHGGEGRDVINGARGADRLSGGKGPDDFQFRSGSGKDTIVDFRPNQDDIEIITGAKSFEQLEIRQRGAHAVVEYGKCSDVIKLLRTDAGDLDAQDFIF